jgi:Cu-Zn family superoxide dismutase
MNTLVRATLPLLISLALFTGCQDMIGARHSDKPAKKDTGKAAAVAHIKPSKAAATQPSWGNPAGTVSFTQMGNKTKVVAHLTGLPPGKHGFHIHEKGDMSSPDLMSTGGHFNPHGHPHGGPTTSPVHAGDFGNITADASGNAHLELELTGLSIGTGAKDDIIGKPVIVHAKPDDLKSQPSGNAGARIAGGLIEAAKK